MRFALLEDDLDQARLIGHMLAEAGYEHAAFASGRDLLAALQHDEPFDLLILDWEVPDITGLEIVRWVRLHMGYVIPVLFVTNRTAEDDLVQGLQAGADDYMTKPISSNELIARIAALLRRGHPQAMTDAPFECGPYAIDPAEGTIRLNGEKVALAPKEFDLALLFFRNPGRLFSRDVLSTTVWNREIPATSRTLDTHLSNMRQKLALRPEHGFRLTSSYALGYRLEPVTDNA
jgi:DNA-binding response OmpR family regulator